MLRQCTSAVLAHALDKAVPWVWIRRHQPKRYLQWWSTPIALSESGLPKEVCLRSLEFDLQFPTHRFLELLPEFSDHGIVLFQMSRPVPDTLSLDRIPDDAIDRVLVQNGLHLAFYLPHAFESAQFRSPNREVIERLVEVPQIKDLVYKNGA